MKKLLGAVALAYAAISGAAQAENANYMPMDKWFVHVGVTGAIFDSGLTGSNNPAVVGASVTNNITGTVEVGRYLNDNISFSLYGGFPPTSDVNATVLTGLPFPAPASVPVKAGSATAGSLIFAGQYHFNREGQISPYVGAGIAYNIVFSTSPNVGGGVTALNIDNGIGGVLQAGVDAKVSEHMMVFVDVKKMFFTAHSNIVDAGLPGGAASVDVRLNPWIVSAGIGFTF